MKMTLHNTVILAATQVRFAHSDIAIPDFSAYRRKESQDPTAKASESIDGRQSYAYLVAGGMFVLNYTKFRC